MTTTGRASGRRRAPAVALPRWLWVPATCAFALVALPVVGLLLRADWRRMPELLTSEAALDALRLSLITAAISTALCVVVLAQTFVALPFLVVSLEGALRTAGGRYEAVAATLGAGPGYAFRHVTVPLVLPGLASGSMLRSPDALASSARRLRSPAACRAPRARCRCWSTCSARPTSTARWRCRCRPG